MGATMRSGSSLAAAIGRATLAALLAAGCSAGGDPQHDGHGEGGHGREGRHMEHRFDDPERYSRRFDDPARDDWQMPERVIAALDIAEGERVADIGAGTGYFSVRLAEQTPARTIYAVDVEPAMVEHVRERAAGAGLRQVVGVVAEPSSPNLPEPVDVALIVNTYHHIPDRVGYFAALRESLAPGVRLAIVDYQKGAAGGGPPDEFRFEPEEIDDELDRAGYAPLARHDFLPRQNFLVYTARD